MTRNEFGGVNTIIKVNSSNLSDYSDDTTVFITRTAVCSEIVKLQNSIKETQEDNKKLLLLMESFHLKEKAEKDYPFRFRFIKMNVKTANTCFFDSNINMYIDFIENTY